MRTVLKNANLIDGVSDQPREGATVIIDDGKIADVTSSGSVSAELIIDCQGGWLLPGLWDAHVHLSPFFDTPDDPIERAILYGHNAMLALSEGGITGLRVVGIDQWLDVVWKNAFASGKYLGPRILAGGHFITTTAGHAITHPAAKEVDGPVEFARAIREEIKHGVDHIKLNLTGGIMGADWDRHWHNFLLEEEMEEAFRISRQRDIKIVAHAANPKAVKDAVIAGAHSIEHGYIMDEEGVQMMSERGTYFVPTLCISHLTPKQATNKWEDEYLELAKIPDRLVGRADDAMPQHREWFQAALRSNLKMAIGSDIGPLKEGALLEMGLWVRDGATPMQAIHGATRIAAEVSGVGAQFGTVEFGKIADLIVLAKNPLDDINNIRSLQMVFKEGVLVVDKR